MKIKLKQKKIKVIYPLSKAKYHLIYKNYVPDPLMDDRKNYIYDKKKVQEAFIAQKQNHQEFFLGILYRSRLLIGSIKLYEVDFEKKTCFINIMIVNSIYKHQGFGSIAFLLTLDYLKDKLGMEVIKAEVSDYNDPMKQILVKNGFKPEDNRHGYATYVYRIHETSNNVETTTSKEANKANNTLFDDDTLDSISIAENEDLKETQESYEEETKEEKVNLFSSEESED